MGNNMAETIWAENMRVSVENFQRWTFKIYIVINETLSNLKYICHLYKNKETNTVI